MIGPRAMDSRPDPVTLDRKKSTKQLISRYESMASQPLPSTTPSSQITAKPAASPAPPPKQTYFSSKKDKSTVRQSFRNLIGIFKKGDSKFKLNQVFSGKRRASTAIPVEPGEESMPSAPSSEVFMSGTVIYMARVSDGASLTTILPVWTMSTITLKPPHLIISSLSINGHPDTHNILLQDVSDVRSLTSYQLDPEELALLPKEYEMDDLRFFELLMDEKPRERFAVTSVHERADWVGSIWDTVLSCRGTRQSRLDNHNPPAQVIDLKPESQTESAASYISNRSLPTIPSEALAGLPLYTEASYQESRRVEPLPEESSSATIRDPTPPSRSIFSSNKPLPPPAQAQANIQDTSMWSTAEAVVDAYGGLSPLHEEPRHDDSGLAITKDLSNLLLGLNNLEQGLSSGLARVERSIGSVSLRMDRTEDALKKMSQDVVKIARTPPPIVTTPSGQSQQPMLDPSHIDHIANSVQTLQILSRELRSVVETLEERNEKHRSESLDAPPQVTAQQAIPLPEPAPAPAPAQLPLDLEPLLARLATIEDQITNSGTGMNEMLKMLKDEIDQRGVQGQQQTDSVRYLNELNTWLESFVNNGATQIQFMHGSVEQIRNRLGCDVPEGPSIVALLQEVKGGIEALRGSIGELVNVTGNRQMPAMSPEYIAELLSHQNQSQEALFRGLTAELTSEIRGERIRFVDAMKEATEINVQSHVEEFKRELKREVHGMTKEVGRLYKERQTMENQIAELFAFYSKQKQGIIPFATAGPPLQMQPQMAPGPGPNGRPLPGPQSRRPGY